jgi:hypothetical protein
MKFWNFVYFSDLKQCVNFLLQFDFYHGVNLMDVVLGSYIYTPYYSEIDPNMHKHS